MELENKKTESPNKSAHKENKTVAVFHKSILQQA